MRPLLSLIVALLLAGAFAGCQGRAPAPTGDAKGTSILSQEPGRAVGALAGSVLDDERLPLSNATITLPDLGPELYTDESGGYRFEKVPVGRHRIVASKAGYTNEAREVVVDEDDTVQATFTLVRLPDERSRRLSIPHDSLHIASESVATALLNSTGAAPACQSCTWVLRAEEVPTFVLIEVFGSHTVANPQGDREYYRVFANATEDDQLLYDGVDERLPIRKLLNSTAINGTKTFWLQLLCETAWVCAQETRETWVTFFYDTDRDEIASDFTGRGKK